VVLAQAAVQQWPLPEMPHTPDVQTSFAVQAPVAICGAQTPALQYEPLSQSLLVAHFLSQPVPAALQIRSPGQAFAIPGSQVPLPSQTPGVSVLPLQLSQLVPA
jgi:hypothetical protein